jgi:methylenetetrahydrofolate dehydrogenase (NADP+)/methenyltetrahydrofolate cyclohydrolase
MVAGWDLAASRSPRISVEKGERLNPLTGHARPVSGPRGGPLGFSVVAATLMNGKALAERVRAEVAKEVEELGRVGLATVLVGDDPASDVYIRGKHRAAEEVGIEARDVRLPQTTTEPELLALVEELNADDSVDGLLVQLPLPDGIDEERVIDTVAPVKDVDGFHPLNAGYLLAGAPTYVGGTPLGVMALLDEYGVELRGARAAVVGRSQIVGKPVSLLLLAEHATVTMCHSRTRDLGAVLREADVVVAAVGVPGLVTAEMVKPGAAVVDVGITRTDKGLRGDVDAGVAEVAGLLTPVPGGVGPMTIAMLLRNAVRAARYRRGLLAYPGA